MRRLFVAVLLLTAAANLLPAKPKYVHPKGVHPKAHKVTKHKRVKHT